MVDLFTLLGTILCALLGVAYLTLVERNLLLYVQTRKGPNNVRLRAPVATFCSRF